MNTTDILCKDKDNYIKNIYSNNVSISG